ncbi:hypothetical protein BDF21DRAFT_362000 [Thamnidium elegans]|uniref:Pleckstrin homology domain-containing protein n=1 Tax=Thamnidium elegans TaxID=101142 RepID=A0A8H7VVP6_9FUNG|nr:hypothetical protein INT48_005005 [Thamnidium elegans]KAI8081109.1 hypothetical protein BDF21DRAFT_362000 [Thamnidium elegans]
MFKSQNQQYPIIIVQDIQHGNISTTNDILNQLQLLRYSSHLKDVNLNQFMQMTNDTDFKNYGIRKERDCQRLSECAQSIGRTSFSSISSTDDSASEESPVMLPSPIYVGDTTSSLVKKNSFKSFLSLRKFDEMTKGDQKWPNSIIKQSPPAYIDHHRRHSESSLVPPMYDEAQQDNSQFSKCVRSNSFHHRTEKLPDYTCTVQKMGKAKAKIEFKAPGIKPRFRPWKDIYLELQGTVLKLYEIVPNTPPVGRYRLTPFYQPVKYDLLFTLSLAHMKAELATDYIKRDHVFRIITLDGPQILIQVQTRASVYGWIDKLASGSNIAVNLEDQRMPKFSTANVMGPLQGCSSMTRSLYQRYLNEERRDAGSADALL